jgi:hypothetical protein
MESYITAGASVILQQVFTYVTGSIVFYMSVCIMCYGKHEDQQKVTYEIQNLPQTFTLLC